MRNIAIIDPCGIPYNGSTLRSKGLGGAESSVIYMAKELVNLNYNVTVYNNCENIEYYYDKVLYCNINNIDTHTGYDIVIVVRNTNVFYDAKFASILDKARYKVLWRHDTYIQKDETIPRLLEEGKITEVFTLSDWHTEHTVKKLYIPRNKIWQTRNGYKHFNYYFFGKKKSQFVFNAASYKGLPILLNEIWPKILENIPEANLIVIGGYYENIPDNNYSMVKEYEDKGVKGVTFTGIIKPEKISQILTESSFFIYPCTFPETFGISTLEAIAYKCIPITINLGALQTTAIDECSYKIDELEVNNFIDLVVEAWSDSSSTLNKMEACEQVLGRDSWEQVAKEWDKHFEEKLMNLPQIDNRKSILIAIPTAKYIEPETFQSIYHLNIPEGYRADFRFFWCYLIDQGRNTIANYAISCGYDYLLAIDADIEIPPDALEKMLEHDKDFVSGMYRMRREEEVLEVYDTTYLLLPTSLLKHVNGLIEVGGVGFGCVLVKTKVLETIGYPQFFYHQAWKFSETFSEDNDFCRKARNKGFKLYCDTSIRCRHKGTVMWEINP